MINNFKYQSELSVHLVDEVYITGRTDTAGRGYAGRVVPRSGHLGIPFPPVLSGQVYANRADAQKEEQTTR